MSPALKKLDPLGASEFKTLPAAVAELMAGRVDVMFAVTGGVAPLIESGKIKAPAVSGRNRQPAAAGLQLGVTRLDQAYASVRTQCRLRVSIDHSSITPRGPS